MHFAVYQKDNTVTNDHDLQYFSQAPPPSGAISHACTIAGVLIPDSLRCLLNEHASY